MSYQVLARKWRPQNFMQMVGQEHVLKALINALESQRLHHAYLFTGTRGVGKTTIGRILAKCLSCDKGITAEPCGTCGACRNIKEGRYVDLIEIDAASRTKVEDMRELLDNVQYAPAEGRFKIYLIDEVHMLSQSSFNALLKTLEEPPEHVKFLFATTDPQKLPVTILSRCLQFNLKNMSPERIVGHLQHVLTDEQVQFEEAALWALARAADGSMRDALSLTDQAIAYGNNTLSETGVTTMLGTVDQKKIYRILDCLVMKNAAAMLAEVQSLAEFSPDYSSVLAVLSEILHRVAIEQSVPGASDNSMGDQQQVARYAGQLCAEDVQLFYQVALVSRQDLAITPDPKTGLEMALLRMMAFQLSPVPEEDKTEFPSGNEGNLEGDSSVLELEETKKKTVNEPLVITENEQNNEASSAVIQTENENSIALEASAPAGPSEIKEPDSSEKEINIVQERKLPEVDIGITESSSGHSSHSPGVSLGGDWNSVVTELGLSGMTLNLMLNSVFELSTSDSILSLYFETGHFRLLNDTHEKKIREAILGQYGSDNQVVFIDGLNPSQETPMMWKERKREEFLQDARQTIASDPHVASIIEQFNGKLIESSIQALNVEN